MDCLFCSIVAGDVPARQVDADEHAVAFLDISPWHRGHTLVIPRRHVADVLSDPSAWAEIAPLVERVSRRLVSRLDADGLNVLSSAGATAGQEVFHLHVHLVPRFASAPGLGELIRPGDDPGDLDRVHALLTGDAA